MRFFGTVASQVNGFYQHPVVSDWATRVVTNGGALPSILTRWKSSIFMTSLDAAGVTPLIKALNFIAPDSLIAAQTPLIKTDFIELILNGDFSVNTANWTATGSTLASVPGGQSGNCLSCTNIIGQSYGDQAIATVAGRAYQLKVYFKIGTDTGGIIRVGTLSGLGDIYTSALLTDANWTQYTVNFVAVGATTYIGLVNGSAVNALTAFWDTVSVMSQYCFDPWTNNNFVGGDLTVNGLQADGATKWLNTGFNSTVAFINDSSAGISTMTPTVVGAAAKIIGVQFSYELEELTGKTIAFSIWNNGADRVQQAAPDAVNFAGFMSGSRENDNFAACYKANSGYAFAQVATDVVARTSVRFNAVCGYFRSSAGAFCPANYVGSFAAFHLGLTAAQTQSLYNAAQALRVALGGGYV